MISFISISREHEWFKVDLPDYLFPTASDVDASVVDTDAIREVCDVSECALNCVICVEAWFFIERLQCVLFDILRAENFK